MFFYLYAYKPSATGKGWKKILRQSGKIAFIFLDRDVAVIASFGYVPAVGYLLLHSWRSARWRVLLGDNGDKKMSIKRDETMIYREQKLPTLFKNLHTSSW